MRSDEKIKCSIASREALYQRRGMVVCGRGAWMMIS